MRRPKLTPHSKIRRQLAHILELHERSRHLPYIRRYHATQMKAATGTARRAASTPILKHRTALPLYRLDPPAGNVDLTNARKSGRVEFVVWNNALPAISEIGPRSLVFSVATGDRVSAQHRILEQLRSNKTAYNLAILSIPVLHFRGLMFSDRKRKARFVIPLRSPMMPLACGKTYPTEVVERTVTEALIKRIKAASSPAMPPGSDQKKRRAS